MEYLHDNAHFFAGAVLSLAIAIGVCSIVIATLAAVGFFDRPKT